MLVVYPVFIMSTFHHMHSIVVWMYLYSLFIQASLGNIVCGFGDSELGLLYFYVNIGVELLDHVV